MKVVGFNGSPRKDGNTAALLGHLFREIELEGIETEMVQLGGKPLRGCIACYKCFENRDGRCAVRKDALNTYIEKMVVAAAIILASPSFFQAVTAEMKALIDRAGFVGLANGKMYQDKVGASLACFRRTGGVHTFETMNHFFLSNDMIVAGRAMGLARDKGDMDRDAEGIVQAQTLGRRIARLLRKLHA
ncbi:MAG: 2-amino-4-deoxychorismate dehydrogenase [Syntrophaceae bacterium PtaU1.Bin231]|nr:MAG: 2-amino-4-deoxychorismate dehydrogenase [Syntrophaceae bacterium PtaU1.Bin231]